MSAARATLQVVHCLKCVGFVVVMVVALGGCARTTNLANSLTDRDGEADADADASMELDADVVLCGREPCQCNNGLDDDGDGLIDGFDPECTGAFDDDEESFATSSMKGGNPLCRGCFFDRKPAGPEDSCRIAASCATGGSAAGAPPVCNTCEVTSMCIDSCLPRTPNGCDCFGCCEVAKDGRTYPVLLVDTCSMADLEKEAQCPPCTPARDTCWNACGRCELCPGKTLADIPSDCQTDGVGFTCDEGTVCGMAGDCPDFSYCTQGCCVPPIW